MSAIFGYEQPRIQQAMLELSFSSRSIDSARQQQNIQLIDAGIQKDVLTSEQRRLLPTLTQPAVLHRLSAGSQTTIRGFYKYTLCRNSLMLSQVQQLECKLLAAGFEPMIALKGMAALAYTARGVGSRYMADVDVLIPNLHQRPEETLRIVESLGLTKAGSSFRSVTLRSTHGLEFDLHWYLHDWALDPRLVDLVRERSVMASIGQFNLRVPCLEHHLAHSVAHGVFSVGEPSCRWVFDVLTVLCGDKRVDMERFCEFANRVDAPKCVATALTELAQTLPADIEFDRSTLLEISAQIKPRSRLVHWLYDRSVVVASNQQGKARHSRLSLMKQYLVAGVYLPWLVKQNGQATFWRYWGWRQAFPPPSTGASIRGFFRELWQRGPVLLSRLFAAR